MENRDTEQNPVLVREAEPRWRIWNGLFWCLAAVALGVVLGSAAAAVAARRTPEASSPRAAVGATGAGAGGGPGWWSECCGDYRFHRRAGWVRKRPAGRPYAGVRQ